METIKKACPGPKLVWFWPACVAFLLAICLPSSLAAQNWKRLKPKVDISLLNIYMSPFNKEGVWGKPFPVKVHPILADYRQEQYDSTWYSPFTLGNNPILHNAIQATLHSQWSIADGMDLHADLLFDQQGHSLGIYNPSTVYFSPQIRAQVDRDFHLGKQTFNTRSAVGTFRNFRMNEGLFLYGLDVQGLDLSLGWKRLRLRYVQINDLAVSVGLNAGEVYFAQLQLDSVPILGKWKLNAGITGLGTSSMLAPGLFSGLQMGPDTRVYAEAGWNLTQQLSWAQIDSVYPTTATQSMGLVIGVEHGIHTPKWELTGRMDLRYYGYDYLRRRRDTWFGYKGSYHTFAYGGEIPRSVYYPLHYNERPFAQLAFFSDFQGVNDYRSTEPQLLANLTGISLVANVRRMLPYDFFLELNLDATIIWVDGKNPFSYPFYTCSVGWQPAPGNRISLGLSNKIMDIQLHYPTHQLLKQPFVTLRAVRDLPDWQKKTWR